MSQVGHNATDEKLQSLVQRLERLEEERAALGVDIKDVYQEVKSNGYDKKIVRKLIAERKRDKADVEEEEALLETYRRALGAYADTPLGAAAMERVG